MRVEVVDHGTTWVMFFETDKYAPVYPMRYTRNGFDYTAEPPDEILDQLYELAVDAAVQEQSE